MSKDKNTIIMSEINATVTALKELEQDYKLEELGAVYSEGDGLTLASQEEFPIRKLTYDNTVIYEQIMVSDEAYMLVSHRFDKENAPDSDNWDFEIFIVPDLEALTAKWEADHPEEAKRMEMQARIDPIGSVGEFFREHHPDITE